MKALIEERKEAYRIFNLPKSERIEMGLTDVASICTHLKVKLDTYYKYKKEWKAGEGEFNPQDFLNENSEEAYKHLIESCKKNNTPALRTFFQLKGDLVEKREDTHKFEPSPNDYIEWGNRLLDELRNRWRESTGVCPICLRPKTLFDQPCVDSNESQATEDSEVATVGLSTGLT